MQKNRLSSLISLFLVCAVLLSACFPAQERGESTEPVAGPTVMVTAQATEPDVLAETPSEAVPEPTAESGTVFAAPPLALPKNVGGVHLHYPLRLGDVELASTTGAAWTRLDLFFWDKIEPVKLEPPFYDWSIIDEQNLLKIAESGMQLSAVVLFTPEWAQQIPGVACGPIADAELPRFAAFMRALVERYSQPPYNIKYWEVGNEPDIDYQLVSPRSGFGCWGDSSDPYYGGGRYARMLQAVYPQIKQANPDAQLLIGGLLMDCDPIRPPVDANGQAKDCSSSRFLEGILQGGGGDYFDGVSFHAYDYYFNVLAQYGNGNWNSAWNTTGPAFIAKARYIRSLLVASGYSSKGLYLTELATVCGRDGTEDYCRTEDLEQTKVMYLLKSFVIGQAEGLEAMIWFGLYGWRASGMVQGKTPLPVYQAMSFYETTLGGAVLQGAVREFSGVQGYQFAKDGKEIWVVWSADGTPQQITLPGKPAAIYNGVGQALETGEILDVTVEPIYLIW